MTRRGGQGVRRAGQVEGGHVGQGVGQVGGGGRQVHGGAQVEAELGV